MDVSQMQRSDLLVIGSSGHLGQSVTELLLSQSGSCRVIPTHRRTSRFSGSLFYDFYAGAPLSTDASGMTVIFSAAVEMDQPVEELEAAMRRLLEQVGASRFVYLSSDAVFGGRRGSYTEMDEPDPSTEYGHNLLMCETLIQSMVDDYCIVRPSYIYGFVRGQLDARLARTRDELLAGNEVLAYERYYKSPLSVHEIAEAVVRLASSDYQGPIHVVGDRLDGYQFRHAAMTALGVDTSRLIAAAMPAELTSVSDTSLDSSRWWSMVDRSPMTIARALREQLAGEHGGA